MVENRHPPDLRVPHSLVEWRGDHHEAVQSKSFGDIVIGKTMLKGNIEGIEYGLARISVRTVVVVLIS